MPRLISIAVLSLIASLIARDTVAEACTLRNGYCVPFVACTEDGAEFFIVQS